MGRGKNNLVPRAFPFEIGEEKALGTRLEEKQGSFEVIIPFARLLRLPSLGMGRGRVGTREGTIN